MVLIRVAAKITPDPYTRNSIRLYSVFIPEAETSWFARPIQSDKSILAGGVRLKNAIGLASLFRGVWVCVFHTRRVPSKQFLGNRKRKITKLRNCQGAVS